MLLKAFINIVKIVGILYLNSLFFEVKGVKFKVIATESKGNLAIQCEDTILNLENGKIGKINREKLLKYYEQGN